MPQSAFPGAKAGILGLALSQVLVGDIVPVSHLPAGHSCGEAGQRNTIGFHEEAERRETALRGTQNVALGWVRGMGSTEHLIPPINCGNRPSGGPR